MIEQLSLGYTDALAPRKVARPSMKPLTVAQAMRDARRRTWQHLARERVEGATHAIPLGKRFWPVSEAERVSVQQLVQSDEVRHLVTQLSHRDDSAEVRMLDVAYWMRGCSSLGGCVTPCFWTSGARPPVVATSACWTSKKQSPPLPRTIQNKA